VPFDIRLSLHHLTMSFAEFFKKATNRKNRNSAPRDPLPGSQSLSSATASRDATTGQDHVDERLSGQGKALSNDAAGKKHATTRPRFEVHAKTTGMRDPGSYTSTKSRGSRNQKRIGLGDAAHPESSQSPSGASGNASRKRARNGSAANPPAAKAAKKLPLTPESLELSDRLRFLSRHKRAVDAADAFWDARYEKVRDPHHACMLVDCCARAAYPGCDAGIVSTAERAVRSVTGSTHPPSVELQTALIKLYAKVGLLSRAASVLRTMCRSETTKPNVRTLNTLLRGCLWTAAVGPESDEEERGGRENPTRSAEQVTHSSSWRGSVTIAEEAWSQYREAVGTRADALDSSSFEYSILLLCQSLNVQAAHARIGELQAQYGIRAKGKAAFVATNLGDSSCDVLETLAIVYLALSRAYALLGHMEETWQSCQRVLSAVSLCQKVRSEAKVDDSLDAGGRKAQRTIVHGGKRQWKSRSRDDSEQQQQEQEQIHRREASNAAFREHKMREVQEEARSMLRARREIQGEHPVSSADLWHRLTTSLFVFPPGEGSSRRASALASDAAAWNSYGGCVVGKSLGMTSPNDLRHKDALHKSGTIKMRKVYGGHGQSSSAPLDVELGSGYGDWIVRCAASQPDRNHVAVEVRADRVFQIFAKASLGADGRPLRNLCVVASDAGSFLRHRLEEGSVSTVYVHHPEPPTQSFGGNQADLDGVLQSSDAASEPNHMLRSDTMLAAARALKPDGGKLVVVTDNRNYGRLVCATLAKASRAHPALIRGPTDGELAASGLRRSSDTPRMTPMPPAGASIALYEKRWIASTTGSNAAASSGSTWFDRLWTTAGASSSHAEQHTRYVILAYRAKTDPSK
jgi:Putative methyltransferase